jgi:nucleotide-binding universal stress UspA family protein
VQNPFRSEAVAFRFLLVLAGCFAAIVLADQVLGRWAALVVALAALAGFTWWVGAGGKPEPPIRTAPARRSGPGEKRILVVANETVGGEKLRSCIGEKSAGVERAEILVVAPALNSPVRQWASDEDPARRQAQERLDASLARLEEAGIRARGEIGDAEPLQAIEDALRTFGADEVIVSTHPEGRSHWLERGLVDNARERFDVPITHVVVDLEAEREEIR